jgi:NTE family protein
MKALVLSGGGSKGAYQVGVLRKLLVDDGNRYDLVAGISVGAINASILAQYPVGQEAEAWDEMKSVWDQVTTSKIRKGWCLVGAIAALWESSVYNSKPLIEWIKGSLDQAKIISSGRKLRVPAVSWDSGESYVADELDPEIASWVAASSSFPVMLSPVDVRGQLWADGGVRSVTPLGEAIRAGATDIDVVMCDDPDLKAPFSSKGKAAVPGLIVRALELMSNQIMRSDLKMAGLKNDLAGPYRQVNIRVYHPSIDLNGIQASLDFEPEPIAKIIALGYEDTSAYPGGR